MPAEGAFLRLLLAPFMAAELVLLVCLVCNAVLVPPPLPVPPPVAAGAPIVFAVVVAPAMMGPIREPPARRCVCSQGSASCKQPQLLSSR